MNILSCFDGISVGKVALDRLGIKVNKYYAFEIDKWAIQKSRDNHPDIIHCGDIKGWKNFSKLPSNESIDLLLAGFPCQSHSIAGNRAGMDDVRGNLLYNLLDIIEYYKPKKFLLENVKGFLSSNKGAAHKMLLEKLKSFGYDVHWNVLNSALVSAQNRERVYYTNFPVNPPQDRGIILADILEDGYVDRDKSYCIDANYFKGGNYKSYFGKGRRQLVFDAPIVRGAAIRNQVTKRGVEEQLNIRKDEKSNCVVPSWSHKLNGMVQVGTADLNGHDILKRVYGRNGKSPTVSAHAGGNQEPKVDVDGITWRKLTPRECALLQTLDPNYLNGISNTQQYRCYGNSWTAEMIVEILKQM